MSNTQLALNEQQTAMTPTDPIGLIRQALSSGTSPEVIRELVALQQSMVRFEWEREERQAKIDFDTALSVCQQKVETLKPNQGRKSKRTDTHDSIFWLDYKGLDAAIRPVYLAEGFSVSFSEVLDGKENYVGMKATLSRGGVSREYFKRLTLTPAFEGMPKADAEASAASRVKRYLILQIFNVAIGVDEDEKKPFQGLPVEIYAPLMEAIEGAASIPAVTAAYIAALKKAITDQEKTAFEKAAQKRKSEIAR